MSLPTPDPQTSEQKRLNDLGFGARAGESPRQRFLNRDGTFNVRRIGLSGIRSTNYFHTLITMTWPRLYLLIGTLYVFLNVVFALAYMACGTDALRGGTGTTLPGHFADCFFFSVHTLATIGYGTLHPIGLAANVLVTVEALVGLCVFALVTGIIFARFSRPVAKLMFSRNALIAPYHGIRAFEFRVVNTLNSELVEMHAKVIFTRGPKPGEARGRVYEELSLERDYLTFFPLQWTVVHPIDRQSPLFGLTEQDFTDTGAEFIILLTGIEETFSEQVHTRTSYRTNEIIFGARFGSMYAPDDDDNLRADLRLLDEWEPAELPD